MFKIEMPKIKIIENEPLPGNPKPLEFKPGLPDKMCALVLITNYVEPTQWSQFEETAWIWIHDPNARSVEELEADYQAYLKDPNRNSYMCNTGDWLQEVGPEDWWSFDEEGIWYIEGITVSGGQDYWGEYWCDSDYDDMRPATRADFELFDMIPENELDGYLIPEKNNLLNIPPSPAK